MKFVNENYQTIAIVLVLLFFLIQDIFLIYVIHDAQNSVEEVREEIRNIPKVGEETQTETTEPEDVCINQDSVSNDGIVVFSNPVVEDPIVYYYTEQDIIDIAKVLYHECRGISSKTEQACVAWVILNRVDLSDSTIYDVVRATNQFAFKEDTPVWDNLYELSHDVLERWNNEKNGYENVGRILPINFIYFHSKNGHNWFRDGLTNYTVWDYALKSPYES